LIFGFLAIREIGLREMAFEKLNFGKTDIQEKIIIWGKWISGNWNWGK